MSKEGDNLDTILTRESQILVCVPLPVMFSSTMCMTIQTTVLLILSKGAETSQDAMAYARKDILATLGPPGCKDFMGF